MRQKHYIAVQYLEVRVRIPQWNYVNSKSETIECVSNALVAMTISVIRLEYI